jgi:hypothetical protein
MPHKSFRNGKADFARFFLSLSKRIVLSSNPNDPERRTLHPHSINDDGTGREQITHDGTSNLFPMFTWDDKTLTYETHRRATSPHDLNVFRADRKP